MSFFNHPTPFPYPTIEIDPKQARRFLGGYPWVYANEITKNELTNSNPSKSHPASSDSAKSNLTKSSATMEFKFELILVI